MNMRDERSLLCRLLVAHLDQARIAVHADEARDGETLGFDLAREALAALPGEIGRFCRLHDLHLVRLVRPVPYALHCAIAWPDAAGAPRLQKIAFRGGRGARPVAAILEAAAALRRGLGGARLTVAFLGSDDRLAQHLMQAVLADLGPALDGTLQGVHCRAPARRRRAPGMWIHFDTPVAGRRRELCAQFCADRWNAATVDASGDQHAARVEAEWAILRWLEGRLEFRHPELQSERNPLLARLLLRWCGRGTPVLAKLLRTVLNCDIYGRFWSPVLLAHPYGIVIHVRTRIGRRVTIMQQVTLGAKDRGVHAAPVLEDDVYVGAGAKVLGAVRVGRGATIGANAVVTRDVPPYATVVGANRIVRALADRPPYDAASGISAEP